MALEGFDVIGIDNDARSSFFGERASTRPISEKLVAELPGFRWAELDIRDEAAIDQLFRRTPASGAGRPRGGAAVP